MEMWTNVAAAECTQKVREAVRETKAGDTLILNFQPQEMGENKSLLLKLLSLKWLLAVGNLAEAGFLGCPSTQDSLRRKQRLWGSGGAAGGNLSSAVQQL